MAVGVRVLCCSLLCVWALESPACGQTRRPMVFGEVQPSDALTKPQWGQVRDSVDRGLKFVAASQGADGSFPAHAAGQPAVTSLGVMAFLSRGHRPGEGPYGETLVRAIDFVLSCQEPDGLLAMDKYPAGQWGNDRRPHTATYNHAISGLMLGEAYGQASGELDRRLKPAIEKALAWARQMQRRPPRYPVDKGGWRYLHVVSSSKPRSDLSATGWFVMFYRSARNAEFDVPEPYVDEAVTFVERCFDPQAGCFFYGPHANDRFHSRGLTGAGILVLAVGGRRNEAITHRASEWLLKNPFDQYGGYYGRYDRFHYGAYYCSQAMYLVGGDRWAEFYQVLARTLVSCQLQDGGWPPENRFADRQYGRAYSTALSVLALTPPYQLLPIYQR